MVPSTSPLALTMLVCEDDLFLNFVSFNIKILSISISVDLDLDLDL